MQKDLVTAFREWQISCLLLLSAGCLICVTGCQNGENSVAEVQGKSPAPAASVDTSKLSPEEQKMVNNAAAQGKYETNKAAQQGNAYMEAMKQHPNR